MFQKIRYDIASIKNRDPAARNGFEIFMLYSGLHAVSWHRCTHWLYRHNLRFLARFISQLSKFFTGIEIHPGAQIGKGLFIDHGVGVVIGETAVIGDDCTIYQGVTLGGTGKETGKRHPTLGNHVLVGSGAKILGPFTVGDYAKVAANSVVLSAIPSNATAVGAPARVVKVAGKRIDHCDMDQVHIPDPVSQELCRLQKRLAMLEEKMQDGLPKLSDEKTKEI